MGLPIRTETKRQSAQSKTANSPRPPKKSVGPNQESKQRCWLILILEGSFIMNLYQLDKQSTKFTIGKYWKDCVKKLDGNDPKCLPTTHGSCINNKAPAHTALSVREFLATKQITVLKHLAYSPDLTPSDFFLFRNTKEILKGRHFDYIYDIGIIQRQLWRSFHKTNSKIVLKGGLGPGIGA